MGPEPPAPGPMILLSFVRSSVIGYGLLFIVSVGLAYSQDRLTEVFGFPGWPRMGMNLLIGGLLAMSVLAGGRAMRGTFRWAAELEEEFRFLLAPISAPGAFMLAVSSGIAEETFFRAVMQPAFGLWVTSLAFGLLHYPMNRRLIPWAIIAIVMGFAFGIIYQTTGSLFAVALAHGLINFFELRSIATKSDPDKSW